MSKCGAFVRCVLVALLSMQLRVAADGAVQPALVSKNPNALQVALSMDRTSYRLSDDPRVSILLRNISANPVLIPNKGAVVDVWLVVTDPSGHELTEDPNVPLHLPPGYSGLGVVIGPGATFVETADKGIGQFFPLSYWGYRLTLPGTYQLTARYRSSDTKSNTVVFTVGS